MGNKSSCDEIRLMADEYTDGSLQGADLKRFEDHIKECDECKAYLNELRAFKNALSDSCEDIPSGLHMRIMDTVHAEMKKNPPKRKHRFLKRTAIIAACATIFFSLVLMMTMLPLWRDANSSEAPPDDELFEESPSSAAGALPNETDSYEKDDHAPGTNEETHRVNENDPLTGENTEDAADDVSNGIIKDTNAPAVTVAPEFDETKYVSDEDTPSEGRNEAVEESVREDTLASNQKPDDKSNQLSPEVSASGNSVPGGNEITMALLIVSGLLAFASFIAFLISLSSIRRTPPSPTETNKKEKK